VTHCASIGLISVGISLADGDIAKCEALSEALGAVGTPLPCDASLINSILDAGMLPIVASVGTDGDGNLYNVNADHAASCIAQLINGHLLLLSDVPGVLDKSKEKIEVLSPQQKDALIADKTIRDGMIVKVNAAQDAATLLQKPVSIGSWNEVNKLLTPEQSFGTQILPINTKA
jgi:acetylglutamate kinase